MFPLRAVIPALAAVLLVGAASCSTSPAGVQNLTVSVSLASSSLMVGQTATAVAVVHDESGTVMEGQPIAWSSSNQAVATIGGTAQVTALGVGTAEITATSGTASGSATVTVAAVPPVPVSSVAVALNAASITAGQTTQATATTRDANNVVLTGRGLTWSSDNTGAATVSSTGLVTSLAAGTAHITATSEGKSGSATLTVTAVPLIPVASVSVALASGTLTAGQTTQATATTRDANNAVLTGRAIAWSSDNTAAATVSATGLVTSVAAGTAHITAASEGKSGSATLTVTVVPPAPVATVTVALGSASLAVTQTTQATATTRDAGNAVLTGRTITWSSDNTAAATVSSTGIVTAAAAGTAHIVATSEGKTGSATLIVTGGTSTAAECTTARPEWIWCDDFETSRLASYFEYDNAGGSYVRAASVGKDASMGMRIHFNAGQVSAGSLKLAFGRTPDAYMRPVDAGTANYREIYWRMYLRNQPGWTGGGGDKLSRASVLTNSSWAQAMVAPLWSGDGADAYRLETDPTSGTDVQGNLLSTKYNDFAHFRYLGVDGGPLQVFDAAHVGQWYCIEAHVRLNDAGSSNGIFEFWVDGAQQVRQSTLNWVGSYSQYGINSLFFESYWNAGSPVAQERYFDNFVVSTQRIGC